MEQQNKLEELVAIEQALIGGVLLDGDLMQPDIVDLCPDDFIGERSRIIFEAILCQYGDKAPVDFVSIYDRLGGSIEFSYFTELYKAALPGHIKYFAEMITSGATRRRVKLMLEEIRVDLNDPTFDVESAYKAVSEKFIAEMAQRKRSISLGTAIDEAIKELDGKTPRVSISTGFESLDHVAGGIRPGNYWVIGGRTSMGKTSLAVDLAVNMAKRGRVLYVSMEETTRDFCHRVLSSQARVDLFRFKDWQVMREVDATLITDSLPNLVISPINLLEDETRWEHIKAVVEIEKMVQPDLSVVFLDHFGLISTQRRFASRWEQSEYLSHEIKALAMKMRIGIVCLCQINRQTEGRKDHRPTLADIRETGAIEQDGDVIMLLYRPGYYDKNKDQAETELLVAKNRHGPTGAIDFRFEKHIASFREDNKR